MSDDEFDLLDELYFLQSYDYLKKELGWEDRQLLATLDGLWKKEFIKCFRFPDEEIFEQVDIMTQGTSYYYLATKKGLLQHTSL